MGDTQKDLALEENIGILTAKPKTPNPKPKNENQKPYNLKPQTTNHKH
jgi:hypothetical protein